MRALQPSASRGAALIEVTIAVGVAVIAIFGTMRLLAAAIDSVTRSRTRSIAAIAAAQKIEQLLALDWELLEDGSRLTDATSDLSVEPTRIGGSGLAPMDDSSLFSGTAGYTDFVDGSGQWLAGGTSPPPGAVFVRQWTVLAAPEDLPDTRVLVVLVSTVAAARQVGIGRSPQPRRPDEVWLTAIRSRRSPI